MNPDSYEINFTIPRGDTGPTGPTNTTAIGFLSDLSSPSSINGTFQSNIPYKFQTLTGALGLNVKYNIRSNPSEIIFQIDGCYKIEYGTIIQIPDASKDKVYTVQVYAQINNGANILPPTFLTIDDDSLYYFSTSTFTNIAAGDIFGLYIKSDQSGNFNYRASYLSGYRLSDKAGRIPSE